MGKKWTKYSIVVFCLFYFFLFFLFLIKHIRYCIFIYIYINIYILFFIAIENRKSIQTILSIFKKLSKPGTNKHKNAKNATYYNCSIFVLCFLVCRCFFNPCFVIVTPQSHIIFSFLSHFSNGSNHSLIGFVLIYCSTYLNIHGG